MTRQEARKIKRLEIYFKTLKATNFKDKEVYIYRLHRLDALIDRVFCLRTRKDYSTVAAEILDLCQRVNDRWVEALGPSMNATEAIPLSRDEFDKLLGTL